MAKKYKDIKVRYIGRDDPTALRHGKVYVATVGQLGVYGIVDESGGKYAYDPKAFEILEDPLGHPVSVPEAPDELEGRH